MKMKVKLGDVCNFYAGTGFPVAYQGKDSGELPFYKVGDIANNVSVGKTHLELCNNYISREDARVIKGVIVPKGTVVFAKIGEALKLNRRAITSCDCLIDNNAMGIAPISYFLKEKYFFYYMKHLKMQELAESTTVPSVRKSKLEAVIIEVPTIQEQEKIENQLDKISDIIIMRKQQLQQLDELVKARFVELFGDPIFNSKNLILSSLNDVCTKITDGTHDTPPRYDSGYLLITGKNIRSSGIIFDDIEFVSEEDHKTIFNRCNPEYGDVLYTNIGVNYGTACYNNLDYEFSMKNVALLKPNHRFVNGYYLWECLNIMRNHILSMNQIGGAQTFMGLATIKKIIIPVPTMELQNQFAAFVEQIDKSKVAVQKALNEAQTLFDSLMQKYFG